MSTKSQQRASIWRQCVLAGMIAAGLSVAAGAASAGECPLDKQVADGLGQKPGPSVPTGVTDTVRASTDLSKEPLALQGRSLRLRELHVAPGGIVPWHSHKNRPAQIYIVSGEIVEYASNCAVPIVHKTGDVAPERNGTQHWWKNEGTVPVVLISVDLFPVETKMDAHTM
ncbi:Cupin domain-containing protein [Burkholderia sp. YR290]|uniref:cupin domain-containing protein n=1 Tax=Paraburkholderia terrae TaxID=311230 RepID=UPI000B945D83|nr:cupin domain-containing protein [Paraburkholderia terrae]BDC44760.1 cupin [Paraburkholderia terrae]SOE86873.1 Cupin domain-containing protein [Burkholderia sp. YR290]